MPGAAEHVPPRPVEGPSRSGPQVRTGQAAHPPIGVSGVSTWTADKLRRRDYGVGRPSGDFPPAHHRDGPPSKVIRIETAGRRYPLGRCAGAEGHPTLDPSGNATLRASGPEQRLGA
jgi:hypothetical protein